MRNYNWIAIGGGFDMEDDKARIHALMRNAGRVSILLDEARVDVEEWRLASGLQAIYLVLANAPGVPEPIIDPNRTDRSGVKSYGVRAHWLADAFVDPDIGAWHLMAHVAAVLTTIHREGGLPLPRLFSGIAGDSPGSPG